MTWNVRVLVPSLCGDTRSRDFDVEGDSFLDAVNEAEGQREDDEIVVQVKLCTPAVTE